MPVWKAEAMRVRRTLAVVASLPLLLAAAGCSGDDEGEGAAERTPQQVVAAAARTLDSTSGVRLRLSTPSLPEGVDGITAADGVATNAPAFDGTISVNFAGTAVEVPVVAVDDTVHAQLPLTTGWSKIDPKEYGAPDPAGLITGDSGFSSLLPATSGVKEGRSVRGGQDNSEVLTTYTGTVPGTAMKQVIPSSSGDSFDVEYQITDDDELREASFTGVFYPSAPEMTYQLNLDEYGVTQQITAPQTASRG